MASNSGGDNVRSIRATRDYLQQAMFQLDQADAGGYVK